jgi:large subunit ribosomal protein L16
MSFIPKKSTKFQKLQKKKIKNLPTKNISLTFGVFGLKVSQNCFLTAKQLDTLKLHLSKGTKKVGRYWIRAFAHFPVTSKPLEVRMGKGKGYVDHWVCKLKKGSILCEISGVSAKQASVLLKKISLKLPVGTIFINSELC